MVGVGLISGIAWFILLAVIAAFITQKLAIEREEKHLRGAVRQEVLRLQEARAAVDLSEASSE